jgi:hypothetical protein
VASRLAWLTASCEDARTLERRRHSEVAGLAGTAPTNVIRHASDFRLVDRLLPNHEVFTAGVAEVVQFVGHMKRLCDDYFASQEKDRRTNYEDIAYVARQIEDGLLSEYDATTRARRCVGEWILEPLPQTAEWISGRLDGGIVQLPLLWAFLVGRPHHPVLTPRSRAQAQHRDPAIGYS